MSGFQLPAGLRPSSGPSSGPSGGGGGGGGGQQSEEQRAEAQDRQQQQAEMKRNMIAAMLESAARERLSRISLTRPQLATQVEDLLVRMGQQGQIRGQVSDEALKGLLEQVSNPPQAKASTAPTSARVKSLGGGITIQRKGHDSDSDEYDL
ncbi:PDCD5-related protein [Dioszegia hungarica]|uniref:PDCD5-related protein n=1 Tax=Dioszegia hungarica TaxID=4972 RepID=A0AA38H4E5_9TREE|nr:PDCD5-related protein [Dioszegia hungarica]KAI9632244.1 PDCD5-related protein [Dioszegia hungarica]